MRGMPSGSGGCDAAPSSPLQPNRADTKLNGYTYDHRSSSKTSGGSPFVPDVTSAAMPAIPWRAPAVLLALVLVWHIQGAPGTRQNQQSSAAEQRRVTAAARCPARPAQDCSRRWQRWQQRRGTAAGHCTARVPVGHSHRAISPNLSARRICLLSCSCGWQGWWHPLVAPPPAATDRPRQLHCQSETYKIPGKPM